MRKPLILSINFGFRYLEILLKKSREQLNLTSLTLEAEGDAKES